MALGKIMPHHINNAERTQGINTLTSFFSHPSSSTGASYRLNPTRVLKARELTDTGHGGHSFWAWSREEKGGKWTWRGRWNIPSTVAAMMELIFHLAEMDNE